MGNNVPRKLYMLNTTTNFLPSSIYAEPAITPDYNVERLCNVYHTTNFHYDNKYEKLRAYHAKLDLLNELDEPSVDLSKCQV